MTASGGRTPTDDDPESWPTRPSAITDEAMRAMGLAARLAAQEDAETGLGHLLAGLLGVPGAAAIRALERAGVSAETLTARAATGEPRTEPGPHASEPNRKVIELALRESLTARHGYVGTGHLLLGFTGLEAGHELLRELGVDADELRPHIFATIDAHPEQRSPRPQPPTAKPLSERMAAAHNLSSFTKRVEGHQAEAAHRVGERLREGIEQATRMMFSGGAPGKPPAARLHAEARAIEMIDATLSEARAALSDLGIELPEQAPPG